MESSDKAVTFRRDKGTNSDIYQEIIVKGKVDTVTKAFNFAVNKYGDQCRVKYLLAKSTLVWQLPAQLMGLVEFKLKATQVESVFI